MDYTCSNLLQREYGERSCDDRSNDGLGAGNAGFALTNYKNVSGTGANPQSRCDSAPP